MDDILTGLSGRRPDAASTSTTDAAPPLTVDTILQSMNRVRKMEEESTRKAVLDGRLPWGVELHVVPDHPKMQLSAGCPVSDDFRKEMNEWMRGFFGMVQALEDGDVRVSQQMGCMWMNPNTFQRLRHAAALQPQGEKP